MSDIIVRQIEKKDLENGFLDSLDSLRKTSDISKEKAKSVFEQIKSNPNHVIFVAVIDDKVIGSTTLLIEPKFIHQGGLVGHIEDVVVTKEHQGKGIGEKVIQTTLNYAKSQGCYKTILDCTDDVKPFYEKLGFTRHANEMRFDHT